MTYHCARFVIYKIYKYSSLDCRLVLTPTLHKLWLVVGIFFLVYALTKLRGGGRDPVTSLKSTAGTQHSSDAPPSVLFLTSTSLRISQ